MDRKKYDKELIKWVRDHYWDSLEKDKDLILRHMRTFAGDIDKSDERMKEALKILEKYNPLRNDLDAYLLYVIEWALENKPKPNPKHFGIKD